MYNVEYHTFNYNVGHMNLKKDCLSLRLKQFNDGDSMISLFSAFQNVGPE